MRPCDLPRQALTLPAPLVETAACGTQGARMDIAPEEVAVALSYNGISHAVMLASPADLADFGLGFSPSEGILQGADELFDLELDAGEHGVVVQMRIAGDRFAGLKERRRADPAGNLLLVREDVGRHNALDKLIGALVRAGRDPGEGFAVATSRVSFEMVQKAASVGIPMLAAVSAPTGYAIRLAQACGLTLAAFVRGTLYAHPERIIAQTDNA